MTIGELLRIRRPFIGLDLETTSANPDEARIVEIGLEIHKPDDDGFSVKEWRSLVNPGVPIPAEATEKHHITDEDVREAPYFGQIADRMAKGLSGCDFGGYNLRYDLKVLDKEFGRERVKWSRDGAKVVDGFRLWQVLSPRTLDDASAEFLLEEDREPGVSHTALFDAKRATRVIARQLLRSDKIPRNVDLIHDLLNPGEFDADGKIVRKDDALCLNFGANRGKSLRDLAAGCRCKGRHVPGCGRGYLEWIRDKGDFSPKVKAACADALK